MNDFIWQNGEVVDSVLMSQSKNRLLSGFWLGDGLFETMLCDGGEIFARERHLRRLSEATVFLGLTSDDDAISEGLDKAEKWLGSKCGQIRVTLVSSGDLIITAREHQIITTPIRLTAYPFPKNERSVLSGIKTLSYGENVAALRYAQMQGFDDVLFLNREGFVMESALANLLVWDGKEWFTPSLASGALPGVTRELLVEEFGIKEDDFNLNDLVGMTSMALTSSLRDIQGVSTFQADSLGLFSFEREPVDRLRALFQDWRKKNPRP